MAKGTIGGLIGGILGAVVWAAIAKFLNVEIGFIAWGVGFAVGLGSAFLGGKGVVNATICATICLLSIAAGKVGAAHWSVTPELIKQSFEGDLTNAQGPDGEAITAEQMDDVVAVVQEKWSISDSIDLAKQNLGVIDILFAVLGIGSAFKLGMGQSNEPVQIYHPPADDNASPSAAGEESKERSADGAPEPTSAEPDSKAT